MLFVIKEGLYFSQSPDKALQIACIGKIVTDANNMSRKYCGQKGITFLENNNIKKEHLSLKILHLKEKFRDTKRLTNVTY